MHELTAHGPVPAVRPDWDSDARIAVLAELGIAAVETDLDGIIVRFNQPAADLYGRDERDMLGGPISTVRLSQSDEAVVAPILGELLEVGRWRGELEIIDALGSALRLDVRAKLLLDGSGQPFGFRAALVDLSERVAAELRVAEIESRPRQATSIGRLDSWEWYPGHSRLITSDQFTALLGLEPGAESTMADAVEAMSSGDRARVDSALEGMRSAGVDSLTVEYRVKESDGTPRWLETHCTAVRDEHGVLQRVTGTSHDVTERVRADDRVRAAAEFWQGTMDSLTGHVAVLDERGDIVAVNAAWQRFSDCEGDGSDYVGANYLSVCRASDEETAQAVAAALAAILDGRQDVFELEYPCHSQSVERWYLLRITRYAGSGPVRLVVMHTDMTERHQAEERAFMQAELLDQVDVAVIVADLRMRIQSWNAGAERLYGWRSQEAIGHGPADLFAPRDLGSRDEVVGALLGSGVWDGEFLASRKDGSTFPAYVRLRMISDRDGQPAAFVSVSMDISERQEAERALLSARNYLHAVTDSMGEGMFALDRQGRGTYINQKAEDLLGWSSGSVVGQDMHSQIHHRRPGGVPLPRAECPICDARQDGKTVRVADDVFIRSDGVELPVAYTAAPFSTDDGIEGCVVVFQDITERKAAARLIERDLEKLAWVERIHQALSEDQFVLYAQPIVDLATGAVVQRELLIRMLGGRGSPDTAELIAPGLFLPVAEEYGLIVEIDRWVIDRAAELAAAGLAVEVNVSGYSISTTGLIDHIERAIGRTGANPALMVFEITETTLVSDEPVARAFVRSLHTLGCQIALDDFGTGYGGFSYLKQLPVDFLKIDMEFVRDLRTNEASRSVVQAIVGLGAGFGLRTVAEGVEDQATLILLGELGVDFAQGFHIGRPAPLGPRVPSRRA